MGLDRGLGLVIVSGDPGKYLFYVPEQLSIDFSQKEEKSPSYFFPTAFSLTLRPVVRDGEGFLQFLRGALERASARVHVPLGGEREALVSRLYRRLEGSLRSRSGGGRGTSRVFLNCVVVGSQDPQTSPGLPLEELESLFGFQSPLVSEIEKSVLRRYGEEDHRSKFRNVLGAEAGVRVDLKSAGDLPLNRVLVRLCKLGYKVHGRIGYDSDFSSFSRFYPEMKAHIRTLLSGYKRSATGLDFPSSYDDLMLSTNFQLLSVTKVSGQKRWAYWEKEDMGSVNHPILPLLREEPLASLEPREHKWKVQLNLFSFFHKTTEDYFREVLLPWIEANVERLGVRLEAKVRRPEGRKHSCPRVENYTLSLLFPQDGVESLEVPLHGLLAELVVSEEVQLSEWEGGQGTPRISLFSQSPLVLIPNDYYEPASITDDRAETILTWDLGSERPWSKGTSFSLRIPKEGRGVPVFRSDVHWALRFRRQPSDKRAHISFLLMARLIRRLDDYRVSLQREERGRFPSLRFPREDLCLDGKVLRFVTEVWHYHASESSIGVPEASLFFRYLLSHLLQEEGGTLSGYLRNTLSDPEVYRLIGLHLFPGPDDGTRDWLAEETRRIISGLVRGVEGFFLYLPREEGIRRSWEYMSLSANGNPVKGPELKIVLWGYRLCFDLDHLPERCFSDKLELTLYFDVW